MSILEFIGCLLAVVGGIWLGAMWLNLDMRDVTYTALDKTHILRLLPYEWQTSLLPQQPDVPRRPDEDEFSKMVESQLNTIREEIKTLKTGEPSSTSEHDPATANAVIRPDGSVVFPPTQRSTLDYWNRLSQVMVEEAALQAEADESFDDASYGRVEAVKARVSRFAADAVDAIPSHRVDPLAIELGDEVAQWYRRSALLYDDVRHSWQSSAGRTGPGAYAEKRARAEVQLQKETELLSVKVNAVRETLGHHYGTEFPVLGQ